MKGKKVQIIPFFYQFSLFKNEREELAEFCCNSKLWYLHFTPNFEQICKFMIYGVST